MDIGRTVLLSYYPRKRYIFLVVNVYTLPSNYVLKGLLAQNFILFPLFISLLVMCGRYATHACLLVHNGVSENKV